MSAIDRMRGFSLKSLEERRANQPEHVDQSKLQAGEPITFYCKYCGWISDILPEDYVLAVIRDACGECQGLLERGWMPE